MRLLIGLDDREGGRDALELARVLSAEGDSALIATVLRTGSLPVDYAILPDEEATEAEPRFATARERLAGRELEARAYIGGSPAAVLTQLAEHEEFDAIVVGSSHRGPLGRAMLGGVGASLLDGSPAAVAVAPRGYAGGEHEPPRAVGVGYDGSPESRLALERGAALAAHHGARLRILTVVVPAVAAPVMYPGVYAAQVPPEPEEVIAAGRAAVDPGLGAESVRLDGDPAMELIRACEEGLDLLVMGSRGYGPLSRVLLGSVSRQVVNRAACPVIVVNRA